MKGFGHVLAVTISMLVWIAVPLAHAAEETPFNSKFDMFLQSLFEDGNAAQSIKIFADKLEAKDKSQPSQETSTKVKLTYMPTESTSRTRPVPTPKPMYKPVPTKQTYQSTESTTERVKSASTSKPTYKPVPTRTTPSTKYPSKPTYKPVPTTKTTKPTYKPVHTTEATSTSKPTPVTHTEPCDNIEHDHSIRVGSVRGIPGVHFPNYNDIPLTDFTCSDKEYIPGFYADMETGCQVFHVCWPHRRESFLCPIGTTFNQAILACDYWYSSNCSLAEHYYHVNSHSKQEQLQSFVETGFGDPVDIFSVWGIPVASSGVSSSSETQSHLPDILAATSEKSTEEDLSFISQFLPVKAKVVVYPETDISKAKIIAEASVGKKPRSKQVLEKPEFSTEEHVSTTESTSPSYTVEPQIARKPKHVGKPNAHDITQVVNKIVEDVFDIARKIVQQVGDMVPEIEKAKAAKLVQNRRPVLPSVTPSRHVVRKIIVKKPVPLPTLNPLFIVKPFTTSKEKKLCPIPSEDCRTGRTTQRPPQRTSSEGTRYDRATQKPKVIWKPQYKPVDGKVSHHDKALRYKQIVDHFLRLLKQKF